MRPATLRPKTQRLLKKEERRGKIFRGVLFAAALVTVATAGAYVFRRSHDTGVERQRIENMQVNDTTEAELTSAARKRVPTILQIIKAALAKRTNETTNELPIATEQEDADEQTDDEDSISETYFSERYSCQATVMSIGYGGALIDIYIEDTQPFLYYVKDSTLRLRMDIELQQAYPYPYVLKFDNWDDLRLQLVALCASLQCRNSTGLLR